MNDATKHTPVDPEILQALLEVADKARGVLIWEPEKANHWLPGLRRALEHLEEARRRVP